VSLVFLPNKDALFLWGAPSAMRGVLAELAGHGTPSREQLIIPPGRRSAVSGRLLPLLEMLPLLGAMPTTTLVELPPSVVVWSLASKLALNVVIRERVAPRLESTAEGPRARWAAALSSAEDAAYVATLGRGMPPAAHAVPVSEARTNEVWAPDALLRAFLDATADALVRSGVTSGPKGARPSTASWESRWLRALSGPDSRFEPAGFAERTLPQQLEAWAEPVLGARDTLRACFRLELPEKDGDAFVLRFLLQSPEDPSLLVPAREVWSTTGRSLSKLGRAFRDPQESLLRALGLAARLFPPVGASLAQPAPEHLEIDPSTAWAFLNEGAPALSEAGFGIIVPGGLTASGQRRLRLRMRVGAKSSEVAGAVTGTAGLALDGLLAFRWEAALGGERLAARELAALARQKAPLVRHRGEWVVVDPRELAGIRERLAKGEGHLTVREALQAGLTGETRADGFSAEVVAEGAFARVLERLRSGAERSTDVPRGLRARLRPYQERGLAWLRMMASLGLGACLADDMGLGKTVQVLAFLLARLEQSPRDKRPTLLVAPTSVVGNWERESARFAPDLEVIRHYGPERAKKPAQVPRRPGALVVTTYGLLRRDAALLAGVEWSTVVLDEAQNIKNAASATARAARALRAPHRFALTGTPVENRLAELWSILEFANPGLLGPLSAFRHDYALPIERFGDEAAAGRLRRTTAPFLLRRVKSDPAVIKDLPPKHEMKVLCTLTREQATLYQAVVDEELRLIEEAEGMERRGRVLALMVALKQICNHPAQYLGEPGPLVGRSGKLARVTEMLEEALAAGDKALVFTQFREMGERLVTHLGAALGTEVLFLHGGTSKQARDELVRRFQEETAGPRLFVLSVKAGGTGLNLTAASHVFHYDRWWNPAVEDQATDRAWRIGQRSAVQVHKLLCAGTLEEKVDVLLERKRGLASRIVGSGEQWLTELGDTQLRELFSLSGDVAIGGDEPDREDAS